MNYEKAIDHIINCAVDTQLFLSGNNQQKMFNLNNPADWGKLMHDNKISCNWWPATEDDGVDYWGASTKVQWQNASDETKPGRAVSICYLKKQEAK